MQFVQVKFDSTVSPVCVKRIFDPNGNTAGVQAIDFDGTLKIIQNIGSCPIQVSNKNMKVINEISSQSVINDAGIVLFPGESYAIVTPTKNWYIAPLGEADNFAIVLSSQM